MVKLLTSDKIYVAHSRISRAGRGVFAKQDIKKGEIIEICPVIEVPRKDVSNMRESILVNYYFYFAKDKSKLAIALGFGSIYNHSYEPNATYKKLHKDKIITFVALKSIKKNEEITVSYNYGNPKDKSKPMNKHVPEYKKS